MGAKDELRDWVRRFRLVAYDVAGAATFSNELPDYPSGRDQEEFAEETPGCVEVQVESYLRRHKTR